MGMEVTMKIINLGSNRVEVQLNNGDMLLYSYNTCVAAYMCKEDNWYKTSKHFSNTTSKHVNTWTVADYGEHPQEWFDKLSKEI